MFDSGMGGLSVLREVCSLLPHEDLLFFADNGRLEPRGIHWCYDNGLRDDGTHLGVL